jgi:C1A family cysteine protease
MSMDRKIVYGWKPGLPDARDYKYSIVHREKVSQPGSVNLQSLCSSVYDQLDIGSCTANCLAGLYECLRKKEGLPTFTPSRLFIYWNERNIEGDVADDAGAIIGDGMQVLQKLGAPHESLWWYNTKKFAVKPAKGVYDDALKHKSGIYSKLDNSNLAELRNCLASGFPFVMGFTAYPSLESDAVAASGFLPMPGPKDKPIGGHAVLCVGYDNLKEAFLMRNSWGPDWGLKGYFWFPFSYATDTTLCDDFWTMRLAN